ncbi:unnamed protein product, partial [Polarella glacialis]
MAALSVEVLSALAAATLLFAFYRLLLTSQAEKVQHRQQTAARSSNKVLSLLLLSLPILLLSSLWTTDEFSSDQSVVDGGCRDFGSPGFSEAVSPSLASTSDVLLSVRKRLSDAHTGKHAAYAGLRANDIDAVVSASSKLTNATDQFEACRVAQAEKHQLSDVAAAPPAHFPIENQQALAVPGLNSEAENLYIEDVEVVDRTAENNFKDLLTLVLEKSEMVTETIGDQVYHRSAYWGIIHVGHPAKPFKVVFDTGSGHLILPSTYCRSAACKAHSRYSRSGSLTSKDINSDGQQVKQGQPRDQLSVSFGTGEVDGVFVEDTVCFEDAGVAPNASAADTDGAVVAAPSDSANLECISLRFIAATEMSEDPFKDFVFDGVFGLGLSGLSQTEQFNFLQ